MPGTKYSIAQFIADAGAIMAQPDPLPAKQAAVGERLSELSRRDDLTRFGQALGASDASTETYILWREPPYTALFLAQFDPGYMSPVHEHAGLWVIGCGYRGHDRWDMYERLDDGSRPGHAELKLIGRQHLPPGRTAVMPAPPRAIHAHNNEAGGLTQELIFSCTKPPPQEERLIYNVEEQTCWPSTWALGPAFGGAHYPPRTATAQRAESSLSGGLFSVGKAGGKAGKTRQPNQRSRPWFCPVCACFA